MSESITPPQAGGVLKTVIMIDFGYLFSPIYR